MSTSLLFLHPFGVSAPSVACCRYVTDIGAHVSRFIFVKSLMSAAFGWSGIWLLSEVGEFGRGGLRNRTLGTPLSDALGRRRLSAARSTDHAAVVWGRPVGAELWGRLLGLAAHAPGRPAPSVGFQRKLDGGGGSQLTSCGPHYWNRSPTFRANAIGWPRSIWPRAAQAAQHAPVLIPPSRLPTVCRCRRRLRRPIRPCTGVTRTTSKAGVPWSRVSWGPYAGSQPYPGSLLEEPFLSPLWR